MIPIDRINNSMVRKEKVKVEVWARLPFSADVWKFHFYIVSPFTASLTNHTMERGGRICAGVMWKSANRDESQRC